jgi:hypothetical protein
LAVLPDGGKDREGKKAEACDQFDVKLHYTDRHRLPETTMASFMEERRGEPFPSRAGAARKTGRPVKA